MVWLGFGVNHLRDLIEHLRCYPWAWFDEVVRHEYEDLRVLSFLAITVLIVAGLGSNGCSVGLAGDFTESAIAL
jgi:hypothetical protein